MKIETSELCEITSLSQFLLRKCSLRARLANNYRIIQIFSSLCAEIFQRFSRSAYIRGTKIFEMSPNVLYSTIKDRENTFHRFQCSQSWHYFITGNSLVLLFGKSNCSKHSWLKVTIFWAVGLRCDLGSTLSKWLEFLIIFIFKVIQHNSS